jgi:hypothetical protein
MKHLIKIYKITIVWSILLISCNSSQIQTQTSLVTPTLNLSTATETPFVNPPTVTSVPTSTLYPALDTESASELALQLLRDNSDCRLPCWWGITPSKTPTQNARSFLNQFSSIASTNSIQGDDGSMRLRIPNGDGLLYLIVEYQGSNDVINRLIVGISQLAQNENGEYEDVFGDPAFMEATQSFNLKEILNSYGQPEEVLVATYSLQPLGWPIFFDIQLFYPEHGFLIVYKSLMEFSTNQQIKGCPSKGNIVMGLWEPGKYNAIKDLPTNFKESLSSFPLSSYLQVDKASGMSIQEFYDAFKNDNGTMCLETPSNLWPKPGQ